MFNNLQCKIVNQYLHDDVIFPTCNFVPDPTNKPSRIIECQFSMPEPLDVKYMYLQ